MADRELHNTARDAARAVESSVVPPDFGAVHIDPIGGKQTADARARLPRGRQSETYAPVILSGHAAGQHQHAERDKRDSPEHEAPLAAGGAAARPH